MSPIREIPNSGRFKAPKRASKTAESRKYPDIPVGKPTEGFIIAIDPGWTTGCAMRIDGELATTTVSSMEELLDLVDGATHVIIEKFTTEGRISKPGIDTVELVGAIRAYCYLKKVPLTIHMPSTRWSHMIAAGKYIGKGKLIAPSLVSKHEKDALAHLLHFEYARSH